MRLLSLPQVVAFLSLFSLQFSCAYEIDPSLKFSEAIETIPIGQHFVNLTLTHPFWLGIANGTLPVEKFIAMTQQDDLYVRNFFVSFGILAEREPDPYRKEFIFNISTQNWEPYFQTYYDKFNCSAPKYMVPRVVGKIIPIDRPICPHFLRALKGSPYEIHCGREKFNSK